MPTLADKTPTCVVRGLSFDALATALGRGRTSVFTLNMMHMRLLAREPEFRESYRQASIVTLDSNLLNTCFLRRRMTVATGSDLVQHLSHRRTFRDRSVLVIGNVTVEEAASVMASRRLEVFRPPFGFIHDPAAVDAVIARVRGWHPTWCSSPSARRRARCSPCGFAAPASSSRRSCAAAPPSSSCSASRPARGVLSPHRPRMGLAARRQSPAARRPLRLGCRLPAVDAGTVAPARAVGGAEGRRFAAAVPAGGGLGAHAGAGALGAG